MPVLAMMDIPTSKNRAKPLDSWDGHTGRYTMNEAYSCPSDCLGDTPKNPGFAIYHVFIYFHELQIKMPVLHNEHSTLHESSEAARFVGRTYEALHNERSLTMSVLPTQKYFSKTLKKILAFGIFGYIMSS